MAEAPLPHDEQDDIDARQDDAIADLRAQQENIQQLIATRADRSFELEMLISGASLFIFSRVPGYTEVMAEWGLASPVVMLRVLVLLLANFLTAISYIVLLNLGTHLLLRAFWLGILGVHSVYPKGPNLDKISGGPLFKAYYHDKIGNLPNLAHKLDAICRQVYGLTTTVIFYIFYSLFLAAVVAGLSSISRLFFEDGELAFVSIFAGLYFLVFGPYLLVYLIDYASGKWALFKGLENNASWRRIFHTVVRIANAVFLIRLLSTLSSTITSNAPPARRVALIILYIAIFYGAMLQNQIKINSSGYLTDEKSPLRLNAAHYEDLSSARRHPFSPRISSEMQSEAYLRVFIPYRSRLDDTLAARFPDLPTLQGRGVQLEKLSNATPADATPQLQAATTLYDILLDNAPIAPSQWLTHRHEESHLQGLVAYLRVDSLPLGPHLLQIVQPGRDSLADTSHIPFIRLTP